MLIGRFAFAKNIFQKALESTSTVMNDIQSELLSYFLFVANEPIFCLFLALSLWGRAEPTFLLRNCSGSMQISCIFR